jgi:hypothetical protein
MGFRTMTHQEGALSPVSPFQAFMGARAAAWLVVVLVCAVGLQFLARWMPPLQSPDELSHLVRIASLTERQWVPETKPGSSTGGSFDVGLAALARAYIPVIRDRHAPVPEEDRHLARVQGWTGQTLHGEAPGSAMVLPLAYAPAALGMAAGRALDLTVLQSYHLGRLASHVFCLAVLVLAFWLWAPPVLAVGVLLLPMSLFQMSAPVVDGPAHALTVLVMSMLMRLRAVPSHRLAVAVAAVLAILVTIRLHLLPLLLMPLWWGWQGMRAGRSETDSGLPMEDGSRILSPQVAKTLLAGSVASTVVIGTWVLWVLLTVVDTRVERPMGTGGVAMHYLTHPQDLLAVISATLNDGERLKFLTDSFIGNLGWLDTRLPDEAYPALWLSLGALTLLGLPFREPTRGTAADRLLLLLCALLSIVIVFALMLLTWSPFPTEKIEGVQGRYFIAPAIVMAYALGSWRASAAMALRGNDPRGVGFPGWSPLQALAVAAFALLSLWFLVPTLMMRYPAWAYGGLWG